VSEAPSPVEDVRSSFGILVGVVVAPGLAQEVATRIADDVRVELRARFEGVSWQTAFEVDRLVEPPATVSEILDAARRRLLEGGWDVAMVVTDLPLRRGGRPVAKQASPAHGVAVVSLPALGAIKLSHRLQRTLLDAAADLIGQGWERDHADAGDRRRRRRRQRQRQGDSGGPHSYLRAAGQRRGRVLGQERSRSAG